MKKGSFNIQPRFGTCFKYTYPCIFLKLLNVFISNLSFSFTNLISFIAHNYYGHIKFSMFFDFLQPLLEIDICLFFIKIKNQNNPICPFIISIGYGPISLLACSVPLTKSIISISIKIIKLRFRASLFSPYVISF